MPVRFDTIWERFLGPVVRHLTGQEELRRFSDSIDWQAEGERLANPNITYPDYYRTGRFHGIEGGYLNPEAAVSYDAITQYALPPSETAVRQALTDAVRCRPRRILDLGCGTGSMTLMLKQAFPGAEAIGLDLSPCMLVMAEYKAKKAGLEIQWRHGSAERTGFPDASFDLVAASLLLSETPPSVSQAIVRESFRLLTAGGEMVVLDGNQKMLRQMDWLNDIFEEPQIKAYAAGSVGAWMGAAGFGAVRTEDIWWVYQVSRGVKPISASDSPASAARGVWQRTDTPDGGDLEGWPAPAFSTLA
ncbi:class I SAM-dependent methyltransferase [Kamptonema formosum]|uniref:class I SAM-dependent methyltransferase n=1 Tax=Kamptonema formosum TaxID=331992 RepID=UPI00034C5D2E|nr:methyltransferase domain-containing protein [Oscillatoria sp. PCC 10802]